MKNILITGLVIFFSFQGWSQTITLESFASGFSAPVDIAHAGDDRLFVVEKGGRIKILNADGTIEATPFLDISSLVSNGSEQGLLGLAFHPDYATNGYFYVNYTDTGGDTQVSRFSVDSGNPNLADPASEFPIIDYTQPFSNHNGGCVRFGPDGYLYIAAGDGGSGGDPGNRAQNTELLLGKLLRIDVDSPGGGNNYGIPPDNPFAGDPPNAGEIWAYGLRNPWKFSFDKDNGDLWIADVGQGTIEEIDHAAGNAAGLNYGWRCYEGSLVYNNTDCPDPSELTFPVGEYNHSVGNSITGGYVYRGSTYNNMLGYYFFADFGSGVIGSIDSDENLTILDDTNSNFSSFGEDVNGELYLVTYSGTIYKIVGEVLELEEFKYTTVHIVPNPAVHSFTIQSFDESIVKFEIFNLNGTLIKSSHGSAFHSKTISTQGFSKGLYLIKAYGEEGQCSIHKLLIE
ncbi:MAG TPA: PQQ-dependent sugar dehydrogenase [Flavobacteriaceae bacterium]|nr:PQQ-dependent sugar dehydrogenase [Flavobacteriaceae bacterium]MCB9214146.1 PQQ-dependent sugar dehydrogenase [Alteromonas sp.]HPF11951.1 PQQ-dependent sugar dehydrogenase [Flavobacteriaceae bacterium]HQU22054.1 PQQ-dependent sugar dehydrogenase [Flavobacteriaceae bacterium]HQU65417.1 PQQ-dependent sugar dehydrogenase [Flavobacteriaceae bacterium]